MSAASADQPPAELFKIFDAAERRRSVSAAWDGSVENT
jgi:hypothetical protein